MKTSKVVKVSYKKPWESKNGTMHSWHVTMDNGDSGECNTKTDKGPWEVGEEANYSLDPREYNGSTFYKITKITPFQQPKSGGGKSWTPDGERETRLERWAKQKLIVRQSSVGYALQLIGNGAEGGATLQNVFDLADAIEEHIYRGIDVSRLVKQQAAPAPEPSAPPVKAAPNQWHIENQRTPTHHSDHGSTNHQRADHTK